MRYKILVVLLTLGMVGGYASGFAHMRHRGCGPYAHNGEGGPCGWDHDRSHHAGGPRAGGSKPANLK